MSKNIVNRLFTTFMLLIAIILAQEMRQTGSEPGLTIRIERPKSRLVNIDSNSYPTKTKKHYILEKKNILETKG